MAARQVPESGPPVVAEQPFSPVPTLPGAFEAMRSAGIGPFASVPVYSRPTLFGSES